MLASEGVPRTIELATAKGITVSLVDQGASIRAILVPMRHGRVNVTLGYPRAEGYRADPNFLGASIGRFAGRIDRGRLVLDGIEYALATGGQGGVHCLHGGPEGFHARRWTLAELDGTRTASFHYVSAAGEQGFPGRLQATVRYSLLDALRLSIEFVATTDAPTVVNLSNHAYFNLEGDGGTIDGHRIRINADRYTPLNERAIPTGEIRSVAGTQYDFREERELNDAAGSGHRRGLAVDQNYVLNRNGAGLELAASVTAPKSGIRLNVYTTQPGIQLYTGDRLSGLLGPRAGLCLETQHFPDSPNRLTFPSCRLNPGGTYRHQTVLEFQAAEP